jgi:hypothetical protein
MTEDSRREQIQRFEFDAEWLAVQQLDLLGQVEAQLRLVRQTMRQIEQLRASPHRVGRELTDAERTRVLGSLTAELDTLSKQLTIEGTTCHEMLAIVERMQRRLAEWVGAAGTAPQR